MRCLRNAFHHTRQPTWQPLIDISKSETTREFVCVCRRVCWLENNVRRSISVRGGQFRTIVVHPANIGNPLGNQCANWLPMCRCTSYAHVCECPTCNSLAHQGALVVRLPHISWVQRLCVVCVFLVHAAKSRLSPARLLVEYQDGCGF